MTILEKRKAIVSSLLFICVSALLIYRDVAYIHDPYILSFVEAARVATFLVAVRTIYLYNKRRGIPSAFLRSANVSFVTVLALDAVVSFTRPRNAVTSLLVSVILLAVGYHAPVVDRRCKKIALLLYSLCLVVIVTLLRRGNISTKLLAVAVIAGINVFGISWLKSQVLNASHKPVENPDVHGTAAAVESYHQQILEKIQNLPLTEREKEVASHILLGESRTEIADRMSVSDETIKKHAANIYAKLNVSSKSEFFRAVVGE